MNHSSFNCTFDVWARLGTLIPIFQGIRILDFASQGHQLTTTRTQKPRRRITDSVARFGVILPLWQNVKIFGYFECLCKIMAKLWTYFVKYLMLLGKFWVVVNGQRLKIIHPSGHTGYRKLTTLTGTFLEALRAMSRSRGLCCRWPPSRGPCISTSLPARTLPGSDSPRGEIKILKKGF